MRFIKVDIDRGIATVAIARGTVNALNNTLVEELRRYLEALADDRGLRRLPASKPCCASPSLRR